MKKKFLLFFLSLLIPGAIGCGDPSGKVNVTNVGENCTFEKENDVAEIKKEYSVGVTTKSNDYVVDKYCFKVIINGVEFYKDPEKEDLLQTSVFSFANDKITINKSFVIQDFKIECKAKRAEDATYTFMCIGAGTAFSPSSGTCSPTSDLTIVATPTKPEDGYALHKEQMIVTIGETIYKYGSPAFSIDENGIITIKKDYINGNILVKLDSSDDLFNIFAYANEENILLLPVYGTSDGTVDYSVSFMYPLSSSDITAEKISVMIGETIYTYKDRGDVFSYDPSTRTITLNHQYINADCVIYYGEEEPEPKQPEVYKFIDNTTDTVDTATNPTNPVEGIDFYITVESNEETREIDEESIKVYVNGQEIKPKDPSSGEPGYVYNPETGTIKIDGELITGDVTLETDTKEREDLVKVIFKGENYSHDGKDYAFLGKDYECTITPDDGYEALTKGNFEIYDGDTKLDTNAYEFNESNGTLKIIGAYITQKTLTIKCTPVKKKKMFKVEYIDNTGGKIEFGTKPTSIYDYENLDFTFKISDSEYVYDVDATLNGDDLNPYTKNDGVEYTTIVDSEKSYKDNDKYNDGDTIKVTISATYAGISFEPKSVKLLTYDSYTISYTNAYPDGKVTIKPSTSCKENFDIIPDEDNSRVIISSKTNNVIADNDENCYIEIDNTIAKSKCMLRTRNPDKLQEAIDSTTLALIKGMEKFDLTFSFANNDSSDKFLSRLEIAENLKYTDTDKKGLTSSNYNIGTNITNTFEMAGELSTHGRDYATNSTIDKDKCYSTVQTVNYIDKGKTSKSKLGIDSSKKNLTVYNSEELFWAVEHGYIPDFPSTSGMGGPEKLKVENAETIYNKGRELVLNNLNDNMETIDKISSLYNYVAENSTYDNTNIAKYLTNEVTYEEKISHTSNYLEGFFLNGGYALSDGFSKTLAFLGGLDSLPIVRAFGKELTTGLNYNYSWNYASDKGDINSTSNSWYFLSLNAKYERNDTNLLGHNFAIMNYDSFMRSRAAGWGEYSFTDYTFPSITKIIKNDYYKAGTYLSKDTFTYNGTTYTYNMDDKDDTVNNLKALFNFLNENYSSKGEYNVCISFTTTDEEDIDATIISTLNQSNLKPSKYQNYIWNNGSYCNFVYKIGN